MKDKLTLRMEKQQIERAKRCAEAMGKSVSQMVADYFDLLDQEHEIRREDLPPITRSLLGAWRGSDVDEEDYRRYLEEKHR